MAPSQDFTLTVIVPLIGCHVADPTVAVFPVVLSSVSQDLGRPRIEGRENYPDTGRRNDLKPIGPNGHSNVRRTQVACVLA
jgi:hypothetical protein